jgi:hypothetical protein
MHKRRIAGSRSAVWRFFARRNISFKNVWRAPFASDFDTMITEIGGAYPLVRRGPGRDRPPGPPRARLAPVDALDRLDQMGDLRPMRVALGAGVTAPRVQATSRD